VLGAAALKGWCITGAACFNAIQSNLSQLFSLGAQPILSMLTLDEPLGAVWSDSSFGSHEGDIAYAANETAEFIRLVRQTYPGVKLALQEPYPYLNQSVLTQWIWELKWACAARGMAPPEYFQIDHGWSGQSFFELIGSVPSIFASLRDSAHGAGYGFSYIFWNSPGGQQDSDWDEGVMRQGTYYQGYPTADLYAIDSWQDIPYVTVPEGQPYTFMYTAKRFIEAGYFPGPPVQPPSGPAVATLQASNGQYVVAEGGGGGVVNANRDVAAAWEHFGLVDLNGGSLQDGDPVSFRSDNGSYLQADNGGGGAMLAVAPAIGSWETFVIVRVSGGSGPIQSGDYIALLSSGGFYACAEGGGGDVVNVNRTAIGPWETFRISF